MYALGFVSDPIQYAIETLKQVEEMIGQDKRVEFAVMALEDFRQMCNEELLQACGILQRIIEAYDEEGQLGAMKLGYSIDDARKYMECEKK